MGGVGLELFARRKDGTKFPVEIGSSLIESPEGTLLLSVIVDISTRTQAEAQTRQHREELAHLSRVALMGEMAGSLAHELNQPITGIVNNASAGRRFIAKGRADLPKLDSLFGAVVSDGRRAGEIIRGIRGMVRKGEEVRGPVNLNDVIASVLRFVRSDALGHHCALVTEADPALPFVEADQVQLQQVLLNLVMNAIEAMRETPASGTPGRMKRIAAEGGRARGIAERELRVFVVDDDQSVRTSLANLLATEDYAIEIFASAGEYLARVPHPGPACLVLDVQLPGLNGLALQRQLTEEGRIEQIVFITGHGDIPMGINAMKRGAVDFLPKPFRDDELLSAVAQALARSAEDCQQRFDVVESRARLDKLTPREFEVFRLVIARLLNKEIGAELGVSLRTIKTHRARVMQKIGVVSVAELVRLAQKAGAAPASHRTK